MKNLLIVVALLVVGMPGAAFAQDIDDLLGKIKGAKRVTAPVRVLNEDGTWGDPLLEVVCEWNELGDLTLKSMLGSDSYAYTYDGQNRKTAVVKKDGRGVLQSKSVYAYADDGSYEITEDEYGGEKPGQEKRTKTSVGKYDSKGKILSRKSKSDLIGVTTESYVYDEKDYLVSMKAAWDGGWETKTYKNDARGNQLEIVTRDSDGRVTDRETNAWDERNFKTLTCQYDGKDVLIRKVGIAYVYNDRDHPNEAIIKGYDEADPDKPKITIKVKVEYEYYPKK